MAAIAKSIIENRWSLLQQSHLVANPVKTLVLLHSRFGSRKLVHLLMHYNVPTIFLGNTEDVKPPQQKLARAQNDIRLHAFNHHENRMGNRIRVAVAEAEEYSEGISFMNVRRIVIDQGFGFDASWTQALCALECACHCLHGAENRPRTAVLFAHWAA